jgi:hypothetical protein
MAGDRGGSPASNVVYDLISIQYHALKGSQVYDKYLDDARGKDEIVKFIQQVKEEDARRAVRAHELLIGETHDGLGGS